MRISKIPLNRPSITRPTELLALIIKFARCRILAILAETQVRELAAVQLHDDDIMHPESFLVKRRSQPMEGYRPKKLLDRVRAYPEFILSLRRTSRRDAIRLKHYSCRTEQTYVGWIKRCIPFRGVRHLSETDAPEAVECLT